MHYYIDGYNYMFRTCYAEDDLQEKRQRLLEEINAKVKVLKLDVTIVFDAQHESSHYSRMHFDALEVIFTNYGEIADEYIIQELQRVTSPHMHTVVTSDRKLYLHAKRMHAHAETVEVFIDKLNRRYKNKIHRISHPKESQKQREQQVIESLMADHKKQESQKKLSKPSPKATLGECFSYYLETFEMRFQEESTQHKHKKKPRTKSDDNTGLLDT